MKTFEETRKNSMKYIMNSVIYYTNMMEISQDDKEEVINVVFNMLIAHLDAEAAIEFNDSILSMVKNVNILDIQQEIEELLKNNEN